MSETTGRIIAFRRCIGVLACMALLLQGHGFGQNAASPALLFDVVDNGAPSANTPRILPWKTVVCEPDYAGLWFVAGDLDGDGEPELVSAENFDKNDVHYTSAVAAQKLDGSVIWRWGESDKGRKNLHHDVACQIYDWDGDGRGEVVIGANARLVELDGRTGQERRQWPIAEGASDCLVFCNLRGTPRAEDVLVKDRYENIWAYAPDGALLWHVEHPGGYRTAHQARPLDLDGDGKDEIMAGYAMLNSDGTVRWVYQSRMVDLHRGHLDCMRVMKSGSEPAGFLLALTCCGAHNMAVVDGLGQTKWELAGHHFESVQTGLLTPDRPAPQILVDIDHQPRGNGPLWVVDAEGAVAGKITTAYARQHRLLDWDGDPCDEIFNTDNRTLYNGRGEPIGVLMPSSTAPLTANPFGGIVHIGEITGDSVPDILLGTSEFIYIYKNEHGRKSTAFAAPGTGVNVTLY